DAEIKNDHTTHIKHDKHLTVENDSFTQVKNDQHATIGAESRSKVGADATVNINGSLHQKVAATTAIDSSEEVHLKGGNKVVLDAGSEITIKAGGAFVRVDAAGVHLVGPAINMNSGGSAGSGSGYGGIEAALPMGLEALAAPEELSLSEISASEESMSPLLKSRQISALKGPDPVCEVCEEEPNNE
ncbi:bacteriophage T4 gp5 trimerization domain-containing protein, partial [Vibrio sp. TRT 21S02]